MFKTGGFGHGDKLEARPTLFQASFYTFSGTTQGLR